MAAGIAMMVAMAGCDDSDDNPAAAQATVDITGTWIAQVSDGETVSITVTQSGNGVTGTFFSTSASQGAVSGVVSGNSVNLTFRETNFQRIVTTVKGSVVGDVLTGSFWMSDGTTGTFRAVRT
jgi:hypothetical protein